MKDSCDWIRQPKVDEACDEVAKRRGCSTSQVTPYAVAKYLNCEPNGALYEKVRDWKRRRTQQGQIIAIEVSPAQAAEFRAILDRASEELYAQFLRAVGLAAGEIQREASHSIAQANTRANEAEAETAEVLALCSEADAKFAAAQQQNEMLSKALEEAKLREERLLGRIEQLQASFSAGHSSSRAAKGDGEQTVGPEAPRLKRRYTRRAQHELPLGQIDERSA